jgi:pyrimidine-nucleoside phosphorylase
MNPVRTIQQKRDGERLTHEDIAVFLNGYVGGEIPDYQMAALAMAIYFQGMDPEETAALTEAMLRSGDVLARTSSAAPRVGKHSTGGVGDKVSLVLAPLLACCGLAVPKLSGRGLGPTGGTLDKLEAIPGFRTNLSAEEIARQVDEVGCVITGQTADLVPADRKLYALRDVTGTVPSVPLITASVMSKKLAENLDALVLDVKWGSGASMKQQDDARRLARSMLDVAQRASLPATALVTDMNQPLGRMVGTAVEVQESLATLAGQGPEDLVELTLALGAELLVMAARSSGAEAGGFGHARLPALDEARATLRRQLDSGRALEKFRQMVLAQGGDPDSPLELAPATEIVAVRGGFVASIDCEAIGYAVIALGGGRQKLGETIDPSVGLEVHVRLGQPVSAGERVATLFARPRGLDVAKSLVRQAILIGNQPPPPSPLIVERLP